MKKYPLHVLLNKLDNKRALVCEKILRDYEKQIEVFPGSIKKHHYWVGGYISHIEESMNIAIIFYQALSKKRKLHFTLSALLFVLFIHDFDKLLRYKKTANGFTEQKPYGNEYIKQFVTLLSKKYMYKLSLEEENALFYMHGEGKDYHPTKRVMQPLAALAHCCDIISARVWFNEGKDHTAW